MNLIIDIGNTRVKVAVFQKNKLIESSNSSYSNLNKKINSIIKNNQINNVIVASVGKKNLLDFSYFDTIKKVITLGHKTKVPFTNKYKSPSTLGVDRIALVSAAVQKYTQLNVLIIDAGTCITYDFVNNKKHYLGGAISPGIKMRYKSLNTFTANLPKLEIHTFSLTGKNTDESIHSGVLNGVIKEIEGVIKEYQAKYPNLTVVLTGGDANFLAKKIKSSIFAIPNFLLEGLNSILIHNLDE